MYPSERTTDRRCARGISKGAHLTRGSAALAPHSFSFFPHFLAETRKWAAGGISRNGADYKSCTDLHFCFAKCVFLVAGLDSHFCFAKRISPVAGFDSHFCFAKRISPVAGLDSHFCFAKRISPVAGLDLHFCFAKRISPVAGFDLHFCFAKIIVLPPSSRRQTRLHRSLVFGWVRALPYQ